MDPSKQQYLIVPGSGLVGYAIVRMLGGALLPGALLGAGVALVVSQLPIFKKA